MTPEQADILREPFPREMVGKNQDNLDFVGHAAVTDRLLIADPEWAWDFQATDEHGQPIITMRERVDKQGELTGVKFASMWIRLTVGGVTRPAVGGCDVYYFTTDIEKLLISDAIKNGAMRFGVALDLWSKEDLHAEPTITAEQKADIGKLFEPLEDPDDRLEAMKAWGDTIPGPVLSLPASSFDDLCGSAKAFVADWDTAVYPNPDEGDK